MKNRIEISFPEQSAAEFADRPVTLSDGRPGVRSTMHVEISEPADGVVVTTTAGNLTNTPQPSPPDRSRRRQSARIASAPVAFDCAGFNPEESPPTDVGGYEKNDGADRPAAILDFISSDETLDRCGEIISAGGWRLESYRRNPVFQNAHQYGDIIFTLGRTLITEVRSGALDTRHSPLATPCLFQRIQFASEANPMARIAYALYKGKFLNAVSVGFIPLRWVDAEGEESRGSRVEGRSGSPPISPSALDTRHSSSATRSFRRRYLEQELLEVSAVGIPANPNALQLGLKAGAIQKSDLQELLDLLGSLCSSEPQEPTTPSLQDSTTPFLHFRSQSAVPNTPACASGVRSNEAQWLRLAQEVRKIMRKA